MLMHQLSWLKRGCVAWLLCWAASAHADANLLKVCISEDNPPQSRMLQGHASGLDVRLVQALAELTGQTVQWVPFDTEYEKEANLAHEVNALLSSGVCDVVSAFPLLATDLGPASRATAKTPDYPGAKRKRERPFVALGELVASRAYQAATLGVVLGAGQPTVQQLSDLRGRRVGAVAGTLGGTLVGMYRQGMLRSGMVTLSQREDVWQALSSGRVDALVMPTAAFDAYRLSHPDTALQLARYQRPIGLNLGFVTLASAPADLLQALNTVIEQSLKNGNLQQWAQAEGLSWHAPIAPDVAVGLRLQQLVDD